MLLPQQSFALCAIIGGFVVFETFHFMESLSLPERHTSCAFFAALGGTLGGEAAKKPHGIEFRAAFQIDFVQTSQLCQKLVTSSFSSNISISLFMFLRSSSPESVT